MKEITVLGRLKQGEIKLYNDITGFNENEEVIITIKAKREQLGKSRVSKELKRDVVKEMFGSIRIRNRRKIDRIVEAELWELI